MAERYAISESPSGVGIVAQEDYTLISNGDGTWRTGPGGGGGGAVDSVFGRTGTVDATTGDYTSDQVTNNSGVDGDSVSAALNNLSIAVNAKVASVFGRTGIVVATTGDYTANQVINDSSVAGITVKDALNNLGNASGVSSVFGRVGAVVAASADYTASQVTNDSSVAGTTVRDALTTLHSSNGITNVSDVDGATVTAALNALLNQTPKAITDFHDTETPVNLNTVPATITPDPLPAGLYLVSASVTTTSTNTAGQYTTSFSCKDPNGTLVTKLCLTSDTTLAETQSGQVLLTSDGTVPIKWINVVTTPFVGGSPNVKNKISVVRLVTG